MIIDSHCHIYPDKIAQKASLATGNFYSLPMEYDGSVSLLLKAGAEAGIDRFIVESVATTPAQVNSINSFIAKTVADYSDKMFGLGTMHPDSEDLQGDIEKIKELGLKGVKLHPDIQNFKIDDYRCLKIYELCEKNNLPVLVHAGDKRYDNSNPNRLLPILKIYENLTVIGAHFGGYSVWDEAVEKLAGIKNLYVDCSSSFHALSDEQIKRLIFAYGVDKVLFGTDYPMWNMKTVTDRLLSLNLGEEINEKIFCKNICKVYNLDL